MQSLCTLRTRCRQRPRNTRYQAGATLYFDRIAPACGWRTYSITSSARASNVGGTESPSVLAVLRLMPNSNLVGKIVGIARAPAIVDPHVAAVGPAYFAQPPQKRRIAGLVFRIIC